MCASSSPTSTPPGMCLGPPEPPRITMGSSRALPRTVSAPLPATPPRTNPRKGRRSCSESTITIGYRYFAKKLHKAAPHWEARCLWRTPPSAAVRRPWQPLPVHRRPVHRRSLASGRPRTLRFRPPIYRTGGDPVTTRARALRKRRSTGCTCPATRGARATASACRQRWVGWLRRVAKGPPSCTCTCRGAPARRRRCAPDPTRRAPICTSLPSPSRRPPPSLPRASSAAPSTAWGTSPCAATPTRSVGAGGLTLPLRVYKILCLTKILLNSAQILQCRFLRL